MRFHSAPSWALGILCLASPAVLRAAETCAGSPFVNVLKPREIEESAGAIVGPQIFDVAPHPRGFVLMGNNYGLLRYDGVSWHLMPLGRSAVAFSVAVGSDGRIFAGGARTFGEVVEDPTGQLLYQPFESRLPPEDRTFSDVWQTFVTPSGIAYFRSREKLITVQDGKVRALSPAGRFSAAGLANGVLYAHDSGLGLVVVGSDGAEVAVPGGGVFRSARVTAIADGQDGSLLVGTQGEGIFQFDLERGQSHRLGSALSDLNAADILTVRKLDDGQIAVGTLRRGLFLLDRAGGLRLRMDRDTGLPDNAILTLGTSKGSLWIGTSGGAAHLLLPSSVENFDARLGLPGLVESIEQHRGSIYAATSQGVFRMSCRPGFEPVAALSKQSFALLSAGGLLAATADGIYEISDTGARLIRSGRARGLSTSRDADRLWAATQTGAAGLVRQGKRWLADSPLTLSLAERDSEGLSGVEATSVAEDSDGRLWISLVTGRVLSGVPIRREAMLELTDLQVFGEEEGIAPGFAEVAPLKGGVRIGTGTAILRPKAGRLVPDTLFALSLGAGVGAFRIEDAKDGGYWVASAKRPIRLIREKTGGELAIRRTSLLRTPAGSRILDFLEVSDTEVWVGTDDGAYRFNPSTDEQATVTTSALVRRVQSNQTELFAGGANASLEADLPHLSSVRFEVASSSLDDPSRNRFRFRLDGQDTDWSLWTAESLKDYTNLGPGAYRFRVETRDVYGRIGKEAGFSFVVMTPWYRKPLAIMLGVVALLGLFYGALSLRTRSLRKRQRELETIVDQKTSELREASFTDPLTGLRNRRYFAEVIESEVSLAGRPESPALHLFLVDLDHFKQVNDTHGHAAGDAVLRQTASRLKIATRTSDLIFRWGGEEFLIVARGASQLPRNEIANRIVRSMGKDPFEIGDGGRLPKTCSVGFASYPFYVDNPTTVPLDAVIELADLALYRAKQTGRNRAVGISPLSSAPVPGDIWKNEVLENLEKGAVSVEVLEGPPLSE
ncbi:MAG: diguanylate cyclase [Vicinamibacteria bacterium]|nr:diguanylate cyclase [Vicinamibacteria bacterium]